MSFGLVDIKWWQHIALWFIPSTVEMIEDHGVFAYVEKKRFKGQTFIVGITTRSYPW